MPRLCKGKTQAGPFCKPRENACVAFPTSYFQLPTSNTGLAPHFLAFDRLFPIGQETFDALIGQGVVEHLPQHLEGDGGDVGACQGHLSLIHI